MATQTWRGGMDKKIDGDAFLAAIRATLEELEPREMYKFPVAQILQAGHAAMSGGFRLQIDAVGVDDMVYASLSQREVLALQGCGVFLTKNEIRI